jgi:large subunit ribosomal protein L24
MMKTTQPRKQRLRIYSNPLHRRKLLTSSHLSPELRKKYEARSAPIRKGDLVKVIRGEHKGKEGKVSKVVSSRVNVEGITRSKTDGTKVFVPIHPSNLIILDLDLSDERRKNAINRKIKTKKEVKK